jgi:hypothetical protein
MYVQRNILNSLPTTLRIFFFIERTTYKIKFDVLYFVTSEFFSLFVCINYRSYAVFLCVYSACCFSAWKCYEIFTFAHLPICKKLATTPAPITNRFFCHFLSKIFATFSTASRRSSIFFSILNINHASMIPNKPNCMKGSIDVGSIMLHSPIKYSCLTLRPRLLL